MVLLLVAFIIFVTGGASGCLCGLIQAFRGESVRTQVRDALMVALSVWAGMVLGLLVPVSWLVGS